MINYFEKLYWGAISNKVMTSATYLNETCGFISKFGNTNNTFYVNFCLQLQNSLVKFEYFFLIKL